MESSKWTEMKVGVFVALGALMLIISIILLGGDRAFFNKTYTLHMQLKSVQGLNDGSVVSLAGMNIGNVKKMSFVKGSDLLDVWLEVDQSFQGRITEGSRASVKTQGALGDKYIYIEPGPLDGAAFKDGDLVPTDTEGDFFDRIEKKGGQLTNIVDVVNEALILLKGLNGEGQSAKLMGRLVSAVDGIDHTMRELEKLAQDARGGKDQQELKRAIHSLSQILGKLERGDGTLGALINDRSLYERLSQLVGANPRSQTMKSIIRDSIRKGEASVKTSTTK